MSFFKYEHPPHASRHLPPRARHACRSRPPGRRASVDLGADPRAAAWRRARPRRASPWTAARLLASSETRLSVASPRGVRPRPPPSRPPSSGIARRTSGRDVASRASSLAGWTHGFGDADSGPVDGAAMPPSPSPTRLGFSTDSSRCAPASFAAALARAAASSPGPGSPPSRPPRRSRRATSASRRTPSPPLS